MKFRRFLNNCQFERSRERELTVIMDNVNRLSTALEVTQK